VDAAQRAGAGDRAVRLGDVERTAGDLRERVLAEPLEEQTSLVGVLDGGQLESAGHGQLADLHRGRLTGRYPAGGRECGRRTGGHVGWLVTGASGLLGTDLCRALERRDIAVTAVDRGDLDLLDPIAVGEAVAAHEVVVNCAAWTAVDDAEAHEEQAFEINAIAPGVLARAAAEHGRLIVQLSTDYVFDGTARAPYDVDAPQQARSVYGRTKAAGEEEVRTAAPEHHLVVRTAWLYGAHGSCFPRTIARLARERGHVAVVEDQVGQPTWTVDVAELIYRLVESGAPAGTWHATSAGETSWFGFARRVVESAGLSPEVVSPTSTVVMNARAPRPAYSVLGHEKLHAHGIEAIGSWEERWEAAASAVLVLEQPD
jgi:dTDP-4-dehydrorhamnose reductase